MDIKNGGSHRIKVAVEPQTFGTSVGKNIIHQSLDIYVQKVVLQVKQKICTKTWAGWPWGQTAVTIQGQCASHKYICVGVHIINVGGTGAGNWTLDLFSPCPRMSSNPRPVHMFRLPPPAPGL